MRFLILTAVVGLFLASTGTPAAFAADPEVQTCTFEVEGMTCALCGKAISKALYEVEGVTEVKVDQSAERIVVIADSDVSPSKLEKTIESAGNYEAQRLDAGESVK